MKKRRQVPRKKTPIRLRIEWIGFATRKTRLDLPRVNAIRVFINREKTELDSIIKNK